MKLTRTIWLLSLVSLFTDMASEMLFPVIPLYLREIGFSFAAIGLLEGLAEIIAGISKGYFGNLSDHLGKRVPFIKAGYGLSALSKPLLALFQSIVWVFFARTLDRLGKGIRTAARDAMLSAEATPATRARVFGFHRSMDTVGAIIGPLMALLVLQSGTISLRNLFFVAFLPGLLSVALIFLLKDKPAAAPAKKRPGFFSFFGYWKTAGKDYRRLVAGIIFFFLFNSSDVFLLLRSNEVLGGGQEAMFTTIKAYILYNIVYALGAWPAGWLADRLNMKTVFCLGLLLFASAYGAMAFANNSLHLFIIWGVYGLFAATTEGVSKAWVSNLTPQNEQGTALGLLASCQNLAAMAASFTAGWVWDVWGPAAVFLLAAGAAVLALVYLQVFATRPATHSNS
jgi:MFS family permease